MSIYYTNTRYIQLYIVFSLPVSLSLSVTPDVVLIMDCNPIRTHCLHLFHPTNSSFRCLFSLLPGITCLQVSWPLFLTYYDFTAVNSRFTLKLSSSPPWLWVSGLFTTNHSIWFSPLQGPSPNFSDQKSLYWVLNPSEAPCSNEFLLSLPCLTFFPSSLVPPLKKIRP